MPCHAHAIILKATAQHGRLSTAVLCHGFEKNGMVGACHGMASVNQTRPHCVNQMGKTHTKSLAARHGRGTSWERHAMCESAFIVSYFQTREYAAALCQNREQPAIPGYMLGLIVIRSCTINLTRYTTYS